MTTQTPTTTTTEPKQGILLSPNALKHLIQLREQQGKDNLCLRVGVRGGGCSGLSYTMDFAEPSQVTEEDEVYDYPEGLKIVSDRKSLLYLYGLQLDYSDALIGGGFDFVNPNASQTCGCGKSFGV